MSREPSARTYRKELSAEKGFQIFHGVTQKTTAGEDRVGEIEAQFSFLRFLGCFYPPGYGLCKVENKESGKNSLYN